MKKATTAAAAPAKTAGKTPAKRAADVPAAKPASSGAAAPPPIRVPKTSVVARVDVGFGNVLFIRGEGPGMSWDRGTAMECSSSDTWTWSTSAATRPFAYKVLINDEQWSTGDDYVAGAGVQNTISPTF